MRAVAQGRGAIATALIAVAMLSACDVPHTIREVTYGASEAEGVVAGMASSGVLRVGVSFGAGGVKLHAAETGRLYDATVTYCVNHTEPGSGVTGAADGARGGIKLSLHGRTGVFQGFGGEHNRMDLQLSRGMPLDLNLSLGAGESVVDLRGLAVHNLAVTAGSGDSRIVFGDPNPVQAGQVEIVGPIGDLSVDRLGNSNADAVRIRGGVGFLEVDLRGDWPRDGHVLIEAEVGNLELTVPEGPGLELKIGNPWRKNLRLEGFTARGDAFYSDGYDASQRKVHVTIEAGLGRLAVERDGRPL